MAPNATEREKRFLEDFTCRVDWEAPLVESAGRESRQEHRETAQSSEELQIQDYGPAQTIAVIGTPKGFKM